MKIRENKFLASLFVAAAVLVLAPGVASATSVLTVGNQTSIFYNTVGSAVSLGNFNLATEPVGVDALFTANNVTGSLTFGVFTNPLLPGGSGSVDVNIITTNAHTFSGTFAGNPLVFFPQGGDFVAQFATNFANIADVKSFVLHFTGFSKGDQFQVNVSAVPLPPAMLLFGSALAGLGFLGRRKVKPQNAAALA